MNFQHTAKQMLDGAKTQTRRLEKPSDCWWRISDDYHVQAFHAANDDPMAGRIIKVFCNQRVLYEVGKTYAIQPGRTAKGVGRTPPLKSIRRERLGDISDSDCLAEGITVRTYPGTRLVSYGNPIIAGWDTPRAAFAHLWNAIYTKPGTRWHEYPWVWVLEFENGERTISSVRALRKSSHRLPE